MNAPATMLMAKSARAGRAPLTLAQHLADTDSAAANVFRLDRRWGRAFCRFFRIEDQAQRFLLHLRIAALFHDIGKANEEFQAALRQPGQQTLRHEHISALVLHLFDVRTWLAQNPALDIPVITAAVLSHHMKASDAGDYAWGQPSSNAASVALALSDPQVVETLARVAQLASLPTFAHAFPTRWHKRAPWETALRDGLAAARELRRRTRPGGVDGIPRRQLLLAVKSGLVVADSVASGLVREGHQIQAWIDDVVHSAPLTAEDVDRDIIQPRLRQIGAVELHDFQKELARRGPRTLLLAPCGAGKTLAAWAWAREQLRTRACGRVVFLYPTRGTATEGFRDYVGWAPETDVALLHGTARFELEAMAANPPESLRGKELGDEAEARLFAIGLWTKRYFSATVDQFLSFLEHRYASTCLLPVLADAIVILDEVHSYDPQLFRALSVFLRDFDVPTLCMTATLPTARRDEIVAAGLEAFPSHAERARLEDLESKERAGRYRIEWCDDLSVASAMAAEVVGRGHRVLWVVNVVARCQAIARLLRDAHGLQPLVYHSRFRLADRNHAHAATVAAFQQRATAALAVTTQVCEMSLDLDADLLITEVAPCPALVQRFGRANRHLARGPDFRASIAVTRVERAAPYDRKQLDAGSAMVEGLRGRDVSQFDLATALLQHAPDDDALTATASFLTGGYYAVARPLREESEHLVSAVLDCDLEAIEGALRRREAIDGYVLPAPARAVLDRDDRPAFLPRYLSVVSAAAYDPWLGFLGEGALA